MRHGLRLGCFYAKNPKAPYSTAKAREPSAFGTKDFPRHKWKPTTKDEWESEGYVFSTLRWKHLQA